MNKIIAVDFDGTLVTNEFPAIGEPIQQTIDALKREQDAGARVILWTCRVEKRLREAVFWYHTNRIKLDSINKNLPEIIEEFGGDTVKVFAHEYWDDRAVRMPKMVEDAPEGVWEKGVAWKYACSICGRGTDERFRFCPDCGCYME